MAIRLELVESENIFDKIGIDIFDIENEVFRFDNKINSIDSTSEAGVILQECILHFRNAKNKLRNFLKVSENKYIDPDLLNKMDEDIGRLDNNIDLKEKAVIEKKDYIGERTNIKINPLKNILIEAMESLVINAMFVSAKRWESYSEENGIKIKEVKGEKEFVIRKDKYLYQFFLFQEMQPASQSVGAITRQELKSFPKNVTLHNPSPKSESDKKSEEEDGEESDEGTEELLFDEDDEEEKDEFF